MNGTTDEAAGTGRDAWYDVVVVGGGTAGLSGALLLARSRRTVLVVDGGEPRNAPAAHMHNYLSRDGASPMELLSAGRAEVIGYEGQVISGSVISAKRLDNLDGQSGFRVALSDGSSVQARRLLVTTGLIDELPEVEELAERWGRDVLHCPYCHGWEVRDQALGVLATGPLSVHQAQLFRQLSADVTLFLHTASEPSAEEYKGLVARGINVVRGEVVSLAVTGDQLSGVRLASGEVIPRQVLIVGPRFMARADVLTSLGLETTKMRIGDYVIGTYVPADPMGLTAVPGVWVAGNVTDLHATVIGAAAAAVRAAAAINADLIAEDIKHAMAEADARVAARLAATPRPALSGQ